MNAPEKTSLKAALIEGGFLVVPVGATEAF
jgi:hypothetical protein